MLHPDKHELNCINSCWKWSTSLHWNCTLSYLSTFDLLVYHTVKPKSNMGKVAFTCLILLLAVVLVADSFGIRINRRRRSSLRRRTIYTARRRTVVYRRRTHTRYGTSTSIMLSRILRESGSLKRLLYLINSRTATIDSRLRGLITNIGSGVRTTRLYIRNMVNRIYK